MSTHWKKLHNPDYLGSYSLEKGQDLVVEILSVTKEIVKGPDGKADECIVAKLKGQKPMILNATNCKTIAQVCGSPYIEDWAGKSITLYSQSVKAFGEVVDALRVRNKPPELPELLPNSEKWEKAIEYYKANKTLNGILQKVRISEANKQLLIAEATK